MSRKNSKTKKFDKKPIGQFLNKLVSKFCKKSGNRKNIKFRKQIF